MLDFRLKVFQCVAHQLSFTKASEELFITQPAVTKHIKELESEYGIKLFDRIGNKIALTNGGSILLKYADHILTLHNELKFELSQLKGSAEGKLRLGASTTIAQYVIPSDLADFHEQNPGVKLSLINGNTEYIEQRLLKKEIDIAVVEGRPVNQNIHYIPFLDDELLIFTARTNKSVPEKMSLNEFTGFPLVLRERGSGTLEIIEKKLQQLHIRLNQLNILMYLGSTEAIKSFVKTGNGMGIVSKFAMIQELHSEIFKTIKIPELKFDRQFYFIYPQGPDPVGLPKLFFDFLQRRYNF